MNSDNYITAGTSSTRNLVVVDIPYGEYLLRVTVSTHGVRALFDENIQILKKKSVGGVYEDVTGDMITKFDPTKKIKPLGDNLMNLAALVYNTVNGQEDAV